MIGLVVGGITIPVAPTGNKRKRFDMVDRSRAFDGTYRVSQTGSPRRDWSFQTPPVTRSAADVYDAVLANVGSQVCSGDILGPSLNLVLWSEQFDNAAYAKTASTITADAALAPDGNTTGDKLKEDNTNASHFVSQSVTCPLATYVYSVWVKQAERTKCVVNMSDGTTGWASTGVDLAAGTLFATGFAVGSWTNISATISPSFGGWYRVTVTGTRGAGTVTIPSVYTWTTSSSYLGTTGSGIYVWGAQLEAPATAVAGAYVRTTSAAAGSATVSCFTEIDDWAAQRSSNAQYVVLNFMLHEA